MDPSGLYEFLETPPPKQPSRVVFLLEADYE